MNKSIYKYAAEAGIPVGIYLSVMSACLLLSLKVDILPMLIFPLAIGFPFLLARIMRGIARQQPAYLKVSALWLAGIYSVIFGSLICTFLSALYLTFVEPSFVSAYVANAIATIESSPMAAEYEATTSLMREAMDSHMLPSGIEFISTMAWCTCFSGSILSLILAFFIVRFRKRDTSASWR